MDKKLLLVVGTTSDYIHAIRTSFPGRCLFLTDMLIGKTRTEPIPLAHEELICDLCDYRTTAQMLSDHLHHFGLRLGGIACFDCESMELAAIIAEEYSLPYPARSSIGLCRDKYRSKIVWKKAGLRCPHIMKVRSSEDAVDFFREMNSRILLKPFIGSGSELIFCCTTPKEVRANYEIISRRLGLRQTCKSYNIVGPVAKLIAAEEFVDGTEYSCDIVIDNNKGHLLRLTKKIPARGKPCGTTRGYILVDSHSENIDEAHLAAIISKGAISLGVTYGVCMVDFIVKNGQINILEITPRPGGDCLPQLLLRSRGFDILGFALDVAEGNWTMPSFRWNDTGERFMGVRILGNERGTIRHIDTSALNDDPSVLEVSISRRTGHVVELPPNDYDSWVLGHVVAKVAPDTDTNEQAAYIAGRVHIMMEDGDGA